MYTAMRRLLKPGSHGIIDYIVVVFLLLTPALFGLQEPAATFAYVLGGVHLLLTLLTDFPFGVIGVIPFRIHGLIEVLVSIFLVFSPYAIGFTQDPIGSWFFPTFGVIILIVFLVTDYSFPKPMGD